MIFRRATDFEVGQKAIIDCVSNYVVFINIKANGVELGFEHIGIINFALDDYIEVDSKQWYTKR